MNGLPEKLDTLQAIELAEGVEIRLRIAGPILRMWAWLLDLIFIGLAMMVISMVLGITGYLVGGQVVGGMMKLAWLLLIWWYPVFFEASRRGATIGKRIVVMENKSKDAKAMALAKKKAGD